MNRRSALRVLLCGSAGSLPSLAWKEEALFRSDVLLVLLDVSVKDEEGRFVPDLTRDQFSIFENGQPQKITVFDAKDRPVTIGILLDESRSMTLKRPQVISAARTLIEESNRLDEIFVLHFNETISHGLPVRVPFSSNIRELMAALSREVPGGKTALYDVLWEGMGHLRLGRRDKKALVLVSDGGDTASHHNRKETLDMVERGQATIYAIGLYDEGDPDRDPGFLRRLATTTGGEAYLPSSSQELLGLCRGIAREIRARYTIGYLPGVSARPRSFRRIQVRVRDPHHKKLVVRARTGYRYDTRESFQ